MRSLSLFCFSSCLLFTQTSSLVSASSNVIQTPVEGCQWFSQLSTTAGPRIINGTRAKTGDWPWMVALIYADETAVKGQYCGGTLIHPSWVLTAGHCTEKSIGQDLAPEDIIVLMGTQNLALEATDGDRIEVTDIIRHPDYDGHDPNRPPFADIALLKLKHPASQTSILPVAASYSQLTNVGVCATVMGWGSISKTGNLYPDDLRQTEVPITSNAVCNGPYSYPNEIDEKMLCAGYRQGGKDACVGDSGGPLVVTTSTGWKQVGIVSYGEGCALPNYYGVYTRVSTFQHFINEHICGTTETPASPTLKIQVKGLTATASWEAVEGAQGYQFYYALPFTCLLDEKEPCIYSFDLATDTSLTATLKRGDSYYVAVQAYQGNCYSGYSNIEEVVIP